VNAAIESLQPAVDWESASGRALRLAATDARQARSG